MNLGNPAMEAITRLKDNPDWITILAGYGDAVTKLLNESVNVSPDMRTHATSYAAGARDTWVMFTAATLGQKPNVTKQPGVKA